jgi:signal transduction histidine kinase
VEITNKYSILLLENNEVNINSFIQNLDQNVYEVNKLKDVSLFNNSNFSNNIDMLIVGEDFHETSYPLIKIVKSWSSIVPVLFIVSKHDEVRIIKSLEMGVDGFIFTPLNPKLMTARIKSFVDKYEQLYKQFEEKLQNIRGNITMVMPHEFRTSLSGILGLAKTISQIAYEKSHLTKGEIQEIFEMSNFILNSGSYLSRITENFILYSNLQLLKYHPEKKNENEVILLPNTKDVIADISHSLTANTERKNDMLLFLENVQINISQYHFQKIIYELIDNALKFSAVNTEIWVVAKQIEDIYMISIIDSGRGMADTQISKIDAFKQFDRNIYEQQGNGLGLIIAKELTELNNGIFKIASQKEQGTKIIIEFPILK